MKTLLCSAVLLLFLSNGVVRSQANVPGSEQLQSCLLGTTQETWKSLGLTADQLRRIQKVQEACAEECEVAGVKKHSDGISSSDGDVILSEVRNVLSTKQHKGWVDYCAAIGMPKKE